MKNLTCHVENSVCTLTFNRPEALNALNQDTLTELAAQVQEIYQNVKILGAIITGSGEKAFVAGADIKELSNLTPEKALELARKGQKIFGEIENCPKPIIAAVNGFALGGGCELAMACHVRIAVESARLGQPEVSLGIIPGYGGTQRLTQLVGRGKALELMLTGDLISAQEAKMIGLVNHVVASQEDLLVLSSKMLNKIIGKGPIAVANVIKSVNAGFSYENEGYKAEADNFAACAATEDFKEGTIAFMEKRQPLFKGK